MVKASSTYIRCISYVSERLGAGLKFLMLAVIAVLFLETVARTGFSKPQPWSIETALFIYGTYFALGASYVLLHGEHLAMDALYSRWSVKKKAIFDLATFCVLAVYLVVVIWGGIQSAEYSLRTGQRTYTSWAPPVAPIKVILVIGVTMLLLQSIAFLIRDIYTVRGKNLP